MLGEACSNIIAQHQARRTPTHSRIAVWPPVQLVSPQSASLPPSSASQLSGQPAVPHSNLASQSSGQTQQTGQPMTSFEHLHQPAVAATNSALQSSGQPAFASPHSALQSSGQPAFAAPNSALQSGGQPQETVQELSSPQHQDQPVPLQALLGAQQVLNAVTQQPHGEQMHDQQTWYHYLNAQPESAHESEEVRQQLLPVAVSDCCLIVCDVRLLLDALCKADCGAQTSP